MAARTVFQVTHDWLSDLLAAVNAGGPIKTESTLLASAARTVTTNTADQTNASHRGVMLFLNVTVQPGGAESLSLDVQYKDPVSGSYESLAPATATVTAATGLFAFIVYPGSVETTGVATLTNQGVPLPKIWRVRVVHSAAGSWTYSLAACTLI